MSWEHIGECGTGKTPYQNEWPEAQMEMGIVYLGHVCGDPPIGTDLGIMWHEHLAGEYGTIGLHYDVPTLSAEHSHYIANCGIALEYFNQNMLWHSIDPNRIQGRITSYDPETGY